MPISTSMTSFGKGEDHVQKAIAKAINKVRSRDYVKNVCGYVNNMVEKQRVIFETNPQFFVFTNGIRDLFGVRAPFVDPAPSQNLCKWTGYAWVEPTDEEMQTVREFVAKIFPRPEERKLMMMIYVATLFGITLQKLIILFGEGRNGKSAMNGLAMESFGMYAYMLNSNALLDKGTSNGPKPDLANLDYLRFSVMREPDDRGRLNMTLARDLTGGNIKPTIAPSTKAILLRLCATTG